MLSEVPDFYLKNRTVQKLLESVEDERKNLENSILALEQFLDLPENNIFENGDNAVEVLDEKFRERAMEACRRPGCFGETNYVQGLTIAGQQYLYTAELSYNRLDRQFYYVDDFESYLTFIEPITESEVDTILYRENGNSRLRMMLQEYKELKGWTR